MTSDALLVVPSERQVERLGRDGWRAVTRERLRVHLFEVVERERALAAPVMTRILLGDALARLAASDPLLLSSRAGGGEAWERTVEAIDVAVAELRRAGTSLESLARVGREGGAVGARAKLLHDVVRALDAQLDARGLVDARAVGTRLAGAIARAPSSRVREAIGGRQVVARHVFDWDGGDASWWRALDQALGKEGGAARVELPTFEGDARLDTSRANSPLDVVLDDVAMALDAPPLTLAVDATLGDLRLEGAPPADVVERAVSWVASDAEAQARAVVHAVREALASGTPIDGIAVGAAVLDDSALSALRVAFERAGVPLDAASTDASRSSRLIDFVMTVLSIGERGMPRLEIAGLVRSSYVDAHSLGASPAALLDLARALERTPTASAGDARTTLAETARASTDDPSLGASRAELALRVADAILPTARTARRSAHVASARTVMAALGTAASTRRAAERLLASRGGSGSPAEVRAVASDARAWAALDAALLEVERVATQLGPDAVAIAPRTFRHELSCALDEMREGAETAAAAVVVRTLDELAGDELDLLVVIDASEGTLPASADEKAILAESVAPLLRRLDPASAPPSAAVRSARSLAALAAAASRARRVIFTRRARDEEGAAIAPSPVVAWLERGGAPPMAWRASPLDGPITSAAEGRLRRARLGDATDAGRRARIERAREARFESTTAPRDPVLGDLDLDPSVEPRLLDVLVAETGGQDRPLAVTSFERFAACPFQGFALHVLRARRTRPLREIPDARESGTLLHRALAAAFRETADAWRERPRDAQRIRAQGLAACDAVLRAESVASSLRKLAVARIREAVALTLEWSLADDEWDFARAEQPFGEAGAGRDTWPPLVLVDGAVRLALGGSIDRVDTGHGRAAVRVIDYKLSRSGAESGLRGLGETAFQVALYAHAAADALGVSERAGAYVPATRPESVGPRLKKDFETEWAALHAGDAPLTPLEAKVLSIVRGVRLGVLAPRPFDESTCSNCDSSGGCRKPRFAVARDDDGGVTRE